MPSSSGTLSYCGDAGDLLGMFRAPYLVRLSVANNPRILGARMSLAEVARVRVGRGQSFDHERRHDGQVAELRIAVPDSWMSTKHLELTCEAGLWSVLDCESKNGSYLNGKRCKASALRDGDVIQTGNTSFLFRSEVERTHLEPADVDASDLSRLPVAAQTLAASHARIMADIAKVASSMVSIILEGETGTGKEVSARYVHSCSRRAGAFVAVNCGALPATLVESELFGHRKGAFSGATSDRVGLIQASDGGTLFLDEVAELPLEAQVKLLRVLQEREVLPVGATRPIPVDLRVVSATHADLEARVAEGAFRADLYARLAGLKFRLLPLRERREDLGILIAGLLGRVADASQVRFDREALWALTLYDWPRNIRELEQVLAAATAWAAGGPIGLAHLPAAIAAVLHPEPASEDDGLRKELSDALRKHRGNISATAREMGKARVQIRRWCKRFGIDPEIYRA